MIYEKMDYEQIEYLKSIFQKIINNDKTEYSYDKKSRHFKNRNGEIPPIGSRWNSPSEIANAEINLLKGAKK